VWKHWAGPDGGTERRLDMNLLTMDFCHTGDNRNGVSIRLRWEGFGFKGKYIMSLLL